LTTKLKTKSGVILGLCQISWSWHISYFSSHFCNFYEISAWY